MTTKFAFLFPGQGSQRVGMLADYVAEPVVAETLAEASDALHLNLTHLFENGPITSLNQTENTQPALLAASVALWRLFKSRRGDIKPVLMAGHSLGEYSALVCADSIDFTDAVDLVKKRGLYMQQAVAEGCGAMAAILGLADEVITNVCAEVAQHEIVEPVNFNSPGQVVIAGHIEAVERAIKKLKTLGAKRALLLPVSVPSHCALMKPAADKLQIALDSIAIQVPSIPVVHNVCADVCAKPDGIRAHLVAQLHRPVQWVETINGIIRMGASSFVECGPGTVLTGLNKRINRSVPVVSFDASVFMDKWLTEA
ncbi:MAG: ACP S-malonyltransferase [Endozoicomonas sp. (ex Botrylloides leachii)]|nr:ACP S-malonyltransferase [Endozoicomonas sp. (ex Botrylloides leachii)]